MNLCFKNCIVNIFTKKNNVVKAKTKILTYSLAPFFASFLAKVL